MAKKSYTPVKREDPKFAAMLKECLTQPGVLSKAYRAFHRYSFGNQIAAMFQLMERGQPLGPIASFMAWKEKGRSVKKGAKALVLCMPTTIKVDHQHPDGTVEKIPKRIFIWKPHWFVVHDTEGADFVQEEVPELNWDLAKALKELEIEEVPFEMIDGNCQGYAQARQIAINPVAVHPMKTRLHEIAHIVLGHTSEGDRIVDGERLERSIAEVEAEGTAYLLAVSLGLGNLEESRGYVQHWLGDADLPERNAKRIFSAVEKILKAGQPVEEKEEVAA
jgi:hypothetical protein